MATVKSPTPLRTTEREFEEAFAGMVTLMSRIYRKQVIEALQARTIEKFADAQTGNFARVYLSLANATTRKLKSRFNNDRIQSVVDRYLRATDTRTRAQLYERIARTVGIDAKQLIAEEGLKSFTNAMILETTEWAKKLRDETLELYTANTLRVMTLGTSIEGVMAEFDAMEEKRKNHAKFTARNQINNFNSIMNKTRAQKLGIKQAIWVTAGDERVRDSHASRDGKLFDLDKGLYDSGDGLDLLPGTHYLCRCTYSLVIPEDDE